jgi:hypothetical protein
MRVARDKSLKIIQGCEKTVIIVIRINIVVKAVSVMLIIYIVVYPQHSL